MSKISRKQVIKTVTQVTKQKVPLYPYYPVSTKFEQDGNFFVFSVQYPNGVACITFFMIKNDLVRKMGITSIQLAGINDKSVISIIQVINFKYKQTVSNVWGLQGTILVGYRQGHLVIIKFKDKKTQVIHKFNKLIKKEGLISKMSTFLISDEPYKTLIYGPIKKALYSPSKKYAISFLVGNTLVLYKNKQQICQQIMQRQYKNEMVEEQKQGIKAIKIVKNQGIIFKAQNKQICNFIYTDKQQIIVAYSMDSFIVAYSSKDMSSLYSIRTTMPIRKINYYGSNEGNFIIIMPYQDYAIIVDLNKRIFTKLIGHRCFIAHSLIYKNQSNQLVFLSGGMDHRICFDKIQDISVWYPIQPVKQGTLPVNQIMNQSSLVFDIDQDKKGIQFSNKYSLGEYQNARTNNHDYGFSDLIMGTNLIAFPTYDGKIKVFWINYK